MCLPSDFDDEADGHARVLVRAAEAIDDIELLAGELFLCDLLDGLPCLFRSTMVVVVIGLAVPPNRVMRRLVIDDEFVFRGTAREDTGLDIDGAQLRNLALLVARQAIFHLFLEENLVRRIVENLRDTSDAILAQINVCHVLSTSFILYVRGAAACRFTRRL